MKRSKCLILCLVAGCHGAASAPSDVDEDDRPSDTPADGGDLEGGEEGSADLSEEADPGSDAEFGDAEVEGGDDAGETVVMDDGGDAGDSCGSYLPEGTTVNVGRWLPTTRATPALRRTDGNWFWAARAEDGTWRVVRAPPDVNSYDVSLILENVPRAIGGHGYELTSAAAYDASTDRWLLLLRTSDDPSAVQAVVYGSDGRSRSDPLDLTPAPFATPNGALVAADGDGFVVLSVEEPEPPEPPTWSRATHLRISGDGAILERSPTVVLDGYLIVDAVWRGGAWTVWSYDAGGSGPRHTVLWDLAPTGTATGPRSLDDFGVDVPAWNVQLFATGPWAGMYWLRAGTEMQYHYVPFDPDTGHVLASPAAIASVAGTLYLHTILLADENGAAYGGLYVEVQDAPLRARTWFVRFHGEGSITQRTLLSDSIAPGPQFLLRWLGDRYLAGWSAAPGVHEIDELLCADSTDGG